jgi:hypothetical protein
MVEEAVRESGGTIILAFNPWLFAGTDELVARFLGELAAQLRIEGGKRGSSPAVRRVAERLSGYSEILAPFSWLPLVGPWLARLGGAGRAIKALRKAITQQPSIESQRGLVRQELLKLDQRVLVVVDDLDRIEPGQVRDMIRLIKLVGDFPNVTYLLSYDRAPIERALGATPEEGAAYLEKIVQVVHDLPEPPPEAIQQVLLDDLQALVDSVTTGPFTVEDWQNLLPGGIRPFFRTLRDVGRYLNAVSVSLRVIGEEIALVDVLALEAIRVFLPKAYEELSASVPTLTGEGRGGLVGAGAQASDEEDRRRVQSILEAAGDRQEPTREILRRLFPGIGHLVGGNRFVGGEQQARQRLRVAHHDILRTYFRRTLPSGVISGALVAAATGSMADSDRLAEIFDGLDPQTAEGLVHRLEDFEHDYDPRWVEPSIPVLLNQLVRLREGRRGIGSAELTVVRVVLRLLRSIEDEEERLRIIRRMLPKVHHLSGRMELIDTVGHRENVGHRLVSQEAAEQLYEELRAQTMETAPGELSRERSLVHLFVRVLDDRERGPDWIREACTDDAILLQLLRAGLGETTSQTLGDYAVRTRPTLPWEIYEEWIGAEELRRRIEEIARRVDRATLDDRTAAALETAEKYSSGELSNRDDFHRDG